MTAHQTIGSARAETSNKVIAGVVALAAMLLPNAAFGMDSTPRQTSVQAGYLLPLPPIPYLDSMRWMSWQPNAPLLKVDTLLLPDGAQPGKLRLPPESGRDLMNVG